MATSTNHSELAASPSRIEAPFELHEFIDKLDDGVVFLDREWRITYANECARRISHIEPHHIDGPTYWELYPATVGTAQEQIYRTSMEQRISLDDEFFYPPFEIWVSLRTYPIESGIAVHYRDITRLREAETLRDATRRRTDTEQLRRKSEEAERHAVEIETLYRTAPIGLALFDPVEFRYLRVNDRQAAFFGLKPEDVVGRTLMEMAPIPGLRELFEQVAAGHQAVNYPLEGELISNPGQHRYWTVNYSPVKRPDGSVQAISAASLEITQQKKAESALLQSEKLAAVGRLASSISHEINNPLESVTNLIYLIGASASLSPVVREYVELAQAELARVSQIVTQTLRFHRQSVKPGLANAAQLVGPVLNLYRGRLQTSGIHVETRFSDKTRIWCLESEIRQVLTNLIGNGIDAMRSGGRLLVRSCDATDRVSGARGIRIIVADTGHGMSRSTRERIFEPFFSTKDIHGTGLGLWVSTEIVQRHKGRLTVRSSEKAMGHGSIFSLFLPLG
jgi:PAS domain S-box-containing protein